MIYLQLFLLLCATALATQNVDVGTSQCTISGCYTVPQKRETTVTGGLVCSSVSIDTLLGLSCRLRVHNSSGTLYLRGREWFYGAVLVHSFIYRHRRTQFERTQMLYRPRARTPLDGWECTFLFSTCVFRGGLCSSHWQGFRKHDDRHPDGRHVAQSRWDRNAITAPGFRQNNADCC